MRAKMLEAIGIAAPLVVLVACAVARFSHTALLSLAVVLASLFVFFAGYEASRPRLRDIMPAVVLSALGAAGRVLFMPFPSFKPTSAIVIIAGSVFGRRTGFMVGALAALASNFFLGQGPWTPWQMYAWGLMGYGAGLLAETRLFSYSAGVCAYGFVAAVAYGFILNFWSILGFFRAETLAQILAVFAASLPFDVVHGVATVVFLAALYAPWKRKLARIRAKYGFKDS